MIEKDDEIPMTQFDYDAKRMIVSWPPAIPVEDKKC